MPPRAGESRALPSKQEEPGNPKSKPASLPMARGSRCFPAQGSEGKPSAIILEPPAKKTKTGALEPQISP